METALKWGVTLLGALDVCVFQQVHVLLFCVWIVVPRVYQCVVVKYMYSSVLT